MLGWSESFAFMILLCLALNQWWSVKKYFYLLEYASNFAYLHYSHKRKWICTTSTWQFSVFLRAFLLSWKSLLVHVTEFYAITSTWVPTMTTYTTSTLKRFIQSDKRPFLAQFVSSHCKYNSSQYTKWLESSPFPKWMAPVLLAKRTRCWARSGSF